MGLIHTKISNVPENPMDVLNKMYSSNVCLLNMFLQGLYEGEFNFKVQLM